MSELDWSGRGVDWRDATKDTEMAQDWLANERLWGASRDAVPAGYDLDIIDRVRELTMGDLDRDRGWRLIVTLLHLAADDRDLGNVARQPLEEFIREHGDAFYDQIDQLATSDPRVQRALTMALGGWPGSHSRR